MLSSLQRRIAILLHDLPEARDFVLAGGAALLVHGQLDRLTRDLDFFAVDPAAVDRLLPLFEEAVRSAGMTVTRKMVVPGFARLVVGDVTDETGVNLAADARLLPTESSEFGAVLSTEELAVDKVLAVFGRAEARDFMDLAVLEPRFGLDHLCALAGARTPASRRPCCYQCWTGSTDSLGTSLTSKTTPNGRSWSQSDGGDRCSAFDASPPTLMGQQAPVAQLDRAAAF